MGEEKVSSITCNKVDMKNIYKSNRRYTDRNSKSKGFPELDVKTSKISTVLLLLESNEHDVMEKALNHLDKFASMGNHQLYELTENRIYDYLLKLIKSENVIVKKFTYKLIVQLICVVDECRKKLLTDDCLIEETKDIFMESTDDNLLEFSCIILQYICKDLKHIDAMGRDEALLRAIYKRFTSHDPDILLQSLLLLNVIMRNSILISKILTMKDFPFKNLEIELRSDYRQIRMAALESLLIISKCEHPFEKEFEGDAFDERIFGMCMQSEDPELQKVALKLYKNMCKLNEKLLIKLSINLPKFLNKFTRPDCENPEETLSVLVQFSSLEDNKQILIQNGIFKHILMLIQQSCSIEACNFMSVMSTNILCFDELFSENIYVILLDAVMDEQENWEMRSTALLTFHKLINLHGIHFLLEMTDRMSQNFSEILASSPPSIVVHSIIGILEKLACYSELKTKLCASNVLANAIYPTFVCSQRSTKLIIRLFHLIANYIDQKTFRISFVEHKMLDMIQYYLKSHVNQLRVSICNFISMSSNYQELVSGMVDGGILKFLLDDNTIECAVCSDDIEAMLDSNASLRFMLRRKLDVNDRITSGFYAVKNGRFDFMKIREIMRTEMASPIFEIYTVNFEEIEEFSNVGRKFQKDKNLVILKNSMINDQRFKMADDRLKFKMIAQKVANFLQTDDDCISHNLSMHLKTIKFKFSSSILPIGSLMYGKSFEAALLFKALADQANLQSTFTTDKNGKSWNEVFDGNSIVDLIFDIGEMYEFNGIASQKYLQNIS